MCQDSSVRVVTEHDDQGVMVGFQAQVVDFFSFYYNVQTSSGTCSSSYSVGCGALSRGIKQPGHESDVSPSSRVRKSGAIPPLLQMPSWHLQ